MGSGWKSLIFADQEGQEGNENKEEVTPVKTAKTIEFPKEEVKQPTFPKSNVDEDNPFAVNSTSSSDEQTIEIPVTPTAVLITPTDNHNPQLADIIRAYEKGFDDMNREGVDFYEFYKSIIIDDHIDNLTLYPMAFNMMRGLNPNFTKQSAIADAKYYLDNLEAAYVKLKSKGEASKATLLSQKTAEKSSLSGEVDSLEQQMKQIKLQLDGKKQELAQIDGKYTSALNDVELKLEANDTAKNALVGSITKVVNNITKTIN